MIGSAGFPGEGLALKCNSTATLCLMWNEEVKKNGEVNFFYKEDITTTTVESKT